MQNSSIAELLRFKDGLFFFVQGFSSASSEVFRWRLCGELLPQFLGHDKSVLVLTGPSGGRVFSSLEGGLRSGENLFQ